MDSFQVLACKLEWTTLYNGYGVIKEWAKQDTTANYFDREDNKWYPVRGQYLWTHFRS